MYMCAVVVESMVLYEKFVCCLLYISIHYTTCAHIEQRLPSEEGDRTRTASITVGSCFRDHAHCPVARANVTFDECLCLCMNCR